MIALVPTLVYHRAAFPVALGIGMFEGWHQQRSSSVFYRLGVITGNLASLGYYAAQHRD